MSCLYNKSIDKNDQKVKNSFKSYIAMGLMSGTSLDGIDVSIIKTNGVNVQKRMGNYFYKYSENERTIIKKSFGLKKAYKESIEMVTDTHIKAIGFALEKLNINIAIIDIIGFHGQTILHKPEEGFSIQIGDAKKIMDFYNTSVIYDFRSHDIRNGGCGAPLVPVYHKAIFPNKSIVINIGGISNVTAIFDNELIAFDTGPGNAILNDWMEFKTNFSFDIDGRNSLKGKLKNEIINDFLNHNYFDQKFPKSLDRFSFNIDFKAWKEISVEDGARTISELTIHGLIKGIDLIKKSLPNNNFERLIIIGGGAKNSFFVKKMKEKMSIELESIKKHKIDGDFIESEAFAFLAVCFKNSIPVTFENTTGAKNSTICGTLAL